MKKRFLISVCSASIISLTPEILLAQGFDLSEPEELSTQEQKSERFVLSGEFELGGQIVDLDVNSSKFNEYKDDESDAYLNRLYFGVDDSETGRYFDFRGRKISRNDQEFYVEFGSFGAPGSDSSTGWSVDFAWNETPHLLSNSAATPYDLIGGGEYRVARGIVDAIQINNIDNASSWTAADAGPGLAGEDLRIAGVLADSVHLTDLGTQRKTGTLGINFAFSKRTKVRFEFQTDEKDGSIVTGAAIGDRPPRSAAVQLPEPIDHQTYNAKLSLEHVGEKYNIDASYVFSKFENDIDTMTWNSLFFAPGFFTAGATDYDGVRIGKSTLYATTGAIALAPDNTYHNVTVNGGMILPWNSRLSASFAYGRMKQDDDLLPFATSDFGGTQTPFDLPRTSAEAKIETLMFNTTYAINPTPRMSVQLHYRYYDLDNQTEQDLWRGNTQDSSSRSFKSERLNIAYDLRRQDFDVNLSYYLGRAGTLGFAFERDELKRPQREVRKTHENNFIASYRTKPVKYATFNAKYTKAIRDGSPYNSEITDLSQGFDALVVAGDHDNVLLGFANAPALRKFDVSDRERDKVDVSLGFQPSHKLAVNLSYNYRKDDYGDRDEISDTLTTWDSDLLDFVTVSIDPTQLGLLESKSNLYMADINFQPSDKLNLSAFYSREELKSAQRGRFLDENNRLNNIAAGKDWQDTTGDFIWDADFEDTTDTLGVAILFKPIKDKLDLKGDFSHSRGVVDINYVAGAQIAEDDTTSFKDWSEWSSPPDVKFKTNTVTFNMNYAISERLSLGLKYLFETYRVTDWQQQATGAHQTVLNEYYVADQDPETAGTSQDRAGSRLVRLGGILAPSYDAHVGVITLRYSW
jgi:MtrB/PioB family decaheme-associated outer membrane protein